MHFNKGQIRFAPHLEKVPFPESIRKTAVFDNKFFY